MNRGDGPAITLLLALAGFLFAFRHRLAEWSHRRHSALLRRTSGTGRDRTKDARRPLDPLTDLGRACLSALVPTSVEDHRRRINFAVCLITLFVLIALLL